MREQAAANFLIFLFFVGIVYFLPSMLAWWKNHPSRWGITLLNIFTGWTVFGYIVAWIWYAKGNKKPIQVLPVEPVLVREVAPTPLVISSPQTNNNITDIEQLEKLGSLYEKKLLTQEEFEKLKSKLI